MVGGEPLIDPMACPGDLRIMGQPLVGEHLQV